MNEARNFGEFYPKSLVPISKNDHVIFLEKVTEMDCCDQFSHWLIALEGKQMNLGEDYYHWQVVVFPAEIGGSFDFKHPFMYRHSFYQ